ncbi:HER179Wp [Eremothecium sinecaudum]|uniref:Mitochondrial import inner membrane translocase subunit TIM23 n=1 Tax=Eremothecium sinecaudum TaxID=45286 RepID=A0A0X8HU52_9SACH|nr:HER179Wp [Eremothecium sinecaudum]AMD21458.1 HER179Wp [Eremothecium sinecaudum]
MSFLFGGSGKSKEQEAADEDKNLRTSLGFDPNQVTNVANIISTPGGLDISKLHPLAGVEKGVEYLDLEDEQLSTLQGSQGLIPSRGWTDDLCYGTGAVYLTALGLGGSYGFIEGVKNIPPNAPGKLQLNTILNHITRRGPFLGNNAGVLALVYNLVNSSIDSVRGKHDSAGSVVAGALSGAIFKCSKGLKPMGYASGTMALAAAGWCGLKSVLL